MAKSYWGGLGAEYVSPALVLNDYVFALQNTGLVAFNKVTNEVVDLAPYPSRKDGLLMAYHNGTVFVVSNYDRTLSAYRLV